MSRKRHKYYGYKRPVPENIKVVSTLKSKEEDYGSFRETITETRYVIIDADTGEIFDDAQGYGYKTKKKAYAALAHKRKSPKEIRQMEAEKERVRRWLCDHKEEGSLINDMALWGIKDHQNLTEDHIREVVGEDELKSLGLSAKQFLKWWRKL